MKDNEKILKASVGREGDITVRMISDFSKKKEHSLLGNLQNAEKIKFFLPRILHTFKPSIKTVSEMRSFENFNSCLLLGVFLQN